MPERMDGDPGLRACQAEYPAGMSHQERGARVFVRRIQLLDHDERRLRRSDYFGNTAVEFAQPFLERASRARDDDPRFDEANSTVPAFDRAVSRRA
jgi:hypothetical protein